MNFIIMLVIVVAFMLIPKSPDAEVSKEDNTSSETVTTTVIVQGDDANNDNVQPEQSAPKEKKEPFGGLKIGTSNFIVLIVLGVVLVANKVREVKAGQSKEED